MHGDENQNDSTLNMSQKKHKPKRNIKSNNKHQQPVFRTAFLKNTLRQTGRAILGPKNPKHKICRVLCSTTSENLKILA